MPVYWSVLACGQSAVFAQPPGQMKQIVQFTDTNMNKGAGELEDRESDRKIENTIIDKT